VRISVNFESRRAIGFPLIDVVEFESLVFIRPSSGFNNMCRSTLGQTQAEKLRHDDGIQGVASVDECLCSLVGECPETEHGLLCSNIGAGRV